MSEWNHSICDECWEKKTGGNREPIRIQSPDVEVCCFCDVVHQSGIYVRFDPNSMSCRHNPNQVVARA